MSYINAAVYTPPAGKNLPLVAVLFEPNGEVLTARTVPTVEAGEQLIIEVLSKMAKDIGTKVQSI